MSNAYAHQLIMAFWHKHHKIMTTINTARNMPFYKAWTMCIWYCTEI